MSKGFFKVDRFAIDSLSKDATAMFIYVVICSKSRWRDSATVKEGECDLTEEQISEICKIPRSTVHRKIIKMVNMELLKTRTIVGVKGGHKRNILTPLVSMVFDEGRTEGEQQTNNRRTKGEQKANTLEEGRRKTQKELTQSVVDIPSDLEMYRSCIEDWMEFKKEKRQSYKPKGLEGFWELCREIGPSLPGCIKRSIANNYSGVFPPKEEDKDLQPSPAARRGLREIG